MRRKRFQPPKRASSFGLNITSMTDMFTILLVFLLQTYSTSQVEITPEIGIRLPSSSATANPVEGIRLIVSMKELKIGEQSVARLSGNRFDPADLDAKDPSFLPRLFAELQNISKKDEKEHVKAGRVLLQADAHLPYETLQKVMYTASMAGFPQLKLVTTTGE